MKRKISKYNKQYKSLFSAAFIMKLGRKSAVIGNKVHDKCQSGVVGSLTQRNKNQIILTFSSIFLS